MLPTLKDGLSVFVSEKMVPEVGDIIVVKHPKKEDLVLIKRCIKKTDKGMWIEGDNPENSTDSRQLGWFSEKGCIGVVTSIF
jgi:nickel-type superoxide dismutase maturation protease